MTIRSSQVAFFLAPATSSTFLSRQRAPQLCPRSRIPHAFPPRLQQHRSTTTLDPLISCTGTAPAKTLTTDAIAQRFLDWFRGDFDNCNQVSEERQRQASRAESHEQMHCRLTPVPSTSIDSDGDAVLFANYYYNGNPQIFYRQRMYRLVVQPGKDLEMRIYKMTYIHGLRVLNANHDFSKLDLGSLDDTALYERLDGADVFWKYVEEQHPGDDMICNGPHFIGYMREGGWVAPNGSYRIEDDLVLTKEDLWVAEKTFLKDGTMVGGNRMGISHKMQRVRPGDELEWTLDPTVEPIPVPH